MGFKSNSMLNYFCTYTFYTIDVHFHFECIKNILEFKFYTYYYKYTNFTVAEVCRNNRMI